ADATVDQLNGAGVCNTSTGQQGHPAVATIAMSGAPGQPGEGLPVNGRCGYGTRMPLMVLSPFAKQNFVDHTLTDQTSILKFVEDNWLQAQRLQPGASFDTIAGTIENMFDPSVNPPELARRTLKLDPATGMQVAN